MNKSVKKIVCLLLLLILLLCGCAPDGEGFFPLSNGQKSFESISDMRDFYSDNRFCFDGGFLCLDAYACNSVTVLNDFATRPIHQFKYQEKANGGHSQAFFISEYFLYSSDLGNVNKDYDTPAYSLSVCFVSSVYKNPFSTLSYEFERLNDSDSFNHLVKIYSGGECVAKMYYFTSIDINYRWIEDFLSDGILKVFW